MSLSGVADAPERLPRRMLALAPQPFFTPRGTPFSVYYRSLVTAELGFEVDLLTYGQGEDVDLPGVNIIRGPALEFLGKVRTGPSALKLVHDLFMFVRYLILMIRHRYPVVHAHEEAVFFAAITKPLFGFKLVYDMHSSLPEQLENFGYSKSRLLKRVFEFLERRSLVAADAIITICPALQDQVRNLAPWAMDKHELIENSIFEDVRFVTSALRAPETEPRESLPDARALAKGARAVVYAGTLEPYQGIDLLIAGVALLAARRDDFRLIIAGGSEPQVEHYKRLASDAGVAEVVTFLGQLRPLAARHLAETADIILSPRSSGTNTPLKTYEQLACGVPLVATEIYSHTQVLDETMAVLVPPSAQGLADGIERLLAEDGLGARLVARAQQHYAAHYARPAYTAKLTRLLERVH
ncbi:MAG: glycosyltransferase family 4 protein [Pseudomonadota bacterium]